MVFVFLTFLSMSAFANSQEFLKVRSLLPNGWDVAKVKRFESGKEKDLESLAKLASESYIYQDITKDGFKDILD